jgi:methionyl-tRNA formyltransferase
MFIKLIRSKITKNHENQTKHFIKLKFKNQLFSLRKKQNVDIIRKITAVNPNNSLIMSYKRQKIHLWH